MENKEIPQCRNSSKSQEKQNHTNKMKNKYYPIVVTAPNSNKKNIERNKLDIHRIYTFPLILVLWAQTCPFSKMTRPRLSVFHMLVIC